MVSTSEVCTNSVKMVTGLITGPSCVVVTRPYGVHKHTDCTNSGYLDSGPITGPSYVGVTRLYGVHKYTVYAKCV